MCKFEIYEDNGAHILEINDLAISDAGLYTCTINNTEGTEMATTTLAVIGKLLFFEVGIEVIVFTCCGFAQVR